MNHRKHILVIFICIMFLSSGSARVWAKDLTTALKAPLFNNLGTFQRLISEEFSSAWSRADIPAPIFLFKLT